MKTLGIGTQALAAQADALAQAAKTPLFAAVDGELAALIAVADPAERESRATIERRPLAQGEADNTDAGAYSKAA